MANKNILIDGCSGFLGKNLIEYFLKKKIRLLLLTRNKKKLKKIFINKDILFFDYSHNSLKELYEKNIYCYIHLATCYGKQNQKKKYVYNVNYKRPLKILNKLKEKNLKYFINTDTYYSKKIMFNDSRKFYVKSKKLFLDDIMKGKKINIINLKIFHMYGLNDRKDKFLQIAIKELKKGGTLNLTSGNQILDFIHVNDVVKAYFLVLKKILKGHSLKEHYEIGTSKGIKLKSALNMLNKYINENATLNFNVFSNLKGENNDVANIRNLKMLGWTPKKNFKSEIKNLIR